jgi:hypothetical protein
MGKNHRNKKFGGGGGSGGGSSATTAAKAPVAATVQVGKVNISVDAIRELSSSYTDFQSYFPLLERFKGNKDIQSVEMGLVANSEFPSNTDDVFVKVVHLLNPDDWIQGNYSFTKNLSMPGLSNGWGNVVDKLQCEENQAYVDTLAVSLLSQLREQELSPHFVKFYGALVAKADKYCYNISEEFQSYKATKWFWTNLGNGENFKLRIYSSEKKRFLNDDECEPFMLKPEDVELLKEDAEDGEDADDDDDEEDDSLENIPMNDRTNDVGSVHSVDLELDESASVRSILRISPSNHTIGGSDDDDDSEDDHDIYAEFKNMPVMLIFMEKLQGVMDDLVDDADEKFTEETWIAWILQIIFALTQAQAFIEIYHNDLHGNNILFAPTDEEFLYYRTKDGQVWKLPTFGKIFCLIDFGRAIFRVKNQLVISDDFFKGNDAEDQYNFGVIRDPKLPAILPNPSFDLVRLAVSIFDALFVEKPAEKKGPMVSVLSKEGSFVVKETMSPLYNLLWSWMVDTKGRNILREEDGTERFPGFDLYKHIAAHCKAAVPREQIRKPIFEKFKFSDSVPSGTIVYPLFV